MHSTKISPEFECQGQRSKVKVTGDKKTKKCSILFGSRPLGRGPFVRHFFGSGVVGGAVLGGPCVRCTFGKTSLPTGVA